MKWWQAALVSLATLIVGGVAVYAWVAIEFAKAWSGSH